jgi:hypothetical protein
MRKILLTLSMLLLFPLVGHTAACAVSSGVTTITDNACESQPDSYGIVMYKMYLCTSAPTQPTTTAAADLTAGGCVLVLDGDSGARIDITGSSKVDFTGTTFTKPAAGVYTHGYMHIDNIFYVQQQRIFNEAKEGSKSGTDNGIHCSTLSGTGTDAGENSTCGSSAITPGIWGSTMTDFDGSQAGIQATAIRNNLNNTGSNITGVLIDTNGHEATSAGEVDSLGGFQSFGTPIVVSKNLKELNVSFGITEGSVIFQDGSDPNVVGFSSGPFQAVITAVNHE